MIKNKLITIKKETCFDKEWALLTPCTGGEYKNRRYRLFAVPEIVRAVTRSQKVFMILSEICLSGAIVRELEWVENDVELHLIAKTQKVADRYSALGFSSVRIDSGVNFNYIHIEGKIGLSVMIEDGYTETDDLIKRIYFDGENVEEDLSFFSDFGRLDLVGESYSDPEYAAIYRKLGESKVKINRIVDVKDYSKSVFENSLGKRETLLIGECKKSAVLGFTESGEIRKIFRLNCGGFADTPIDRLSDYYVRTCSCIAYGGDSRLSEIEGKGNVYIWYDGKIKPFKREAVKVIERTVQTKCMEDFVSENFDRSEADTYNTHSSVAMAVEYRYTLVPPRFNNGYKISELYAPIVRLKGELGKVAKPDLARITAELKAFTAQNAISDALGQVDAWYGSFLKMVKECQYKGYASGISSALALLKKVREHLPLYCEQIFTELSLERSDTKFDKFDAEIGDLERQIGEKKALVERGEDVLRNTSRLRTLEKKVDDLKRLKAGFEKKALDSNVGKASEFTVKCRDILDGRYKAMDTVSDSIGQVLEKTEKTKTMMLEEFAQKNLPVIGKFLDEAICVVESLSEIEIPENYRVFDKAGQRYIVIDTMDEYRKTKELREKFSLFCLADAQ